MTVAQVLHRAAAQLAPVAGAAARLEAEVLLATVRGADRVRLLAALREPVSTAEEEALARLVSRRCCGEPLAYLVGQQEFMSLTFKVNRNVLVPRPETEVLVEAALKVLAQEGWRRPTVVDVGTGCGNIALSLAHYFPRARVIATDLSGAALAVARRNARRLGLDARVSFYRGDLLTPLFARRRGCPGLKARTYRRATGWPACPGPYGGTRSKGREVCPQWAVPCRPTGAEVIVANLPYIPSAELASLPPEVRHEPRLALDGGGDGLVPYRRLLRQVPLVLRRGGYLLLEMSPAQAEELCALLCRAGFFKVEIVLDYGGQPRVILGKLFLISRKKQILGV